MRSPQEQEAEKSEEFWGDSPGENLQEDPDSVYQPQDEDLE